MTKSSVDRSRSRYGEYVTLRFHKPYKVYELIWNDKTPALIARFTETDGEYAIGLWETLEKLYSRINHLEKRLDMYMYRPVPQHYDFRNKDNPIQKYISLDIFTLEQLWCELNEITPEESCKYLYAKDWLWDKLDVDSKEWLLAESKEDYYDDE